MATTGAVIARIISQYSDKGSKQAQKDIAKLGKNIDAFSKRAVKAFGVASLAAVGLAAKLGRDAVQGALEDQKAQAGLALALRNTTNATKDAITANTAFLDSLELQVAIDNNELIPALQKLSIATGDLGKAQQLLKLSTDVAALSGYDLAAVSSAIGKAFNGNFTALNKMNLKLDQAAVKSKNFSKIQKDLTAKSSGAAAEAASTLSGRMTVLGLKFRQVTDDLGYALLPVFEQLVTKIESELIPQFEKFIRLNKTEIVDAFGFTVKLAENFVKAIIKIGETMRELEPLVKVFGTGLLTAITYLKVTGALIAFRRFLGLTVGFFQFATKEVKNFGVTSGAIAAGPVSNLTKSLKILTTVVNSLRVAFGLAALTGTAAVAAGLGLVAGAAVVAYGTYKGLDYLLERAAKADNRRAAEQKIRIAEEERSIQRLGRTYVEYVRTLQKTGMQASTVQEQILAGFKSIEKATQKAQQDAADAAKTQEYLDRLERERLAEEQKRLRIKNLEASIAKKIAMFDRTALTNEKKMKAQIAAIEKKNFEMAKRGIKLTDPDEKNAIQMEAIYQNLVKGGKAILAERTKQQAALDELQRKAAEEYNKLLERQSDILKALSGDNKVTIQEIGLLAKQWGLSAEAAEYYVQSVLGIQDTKVDATGVQFLKAAWGMTTREAEQYRAFMAAIKAGHGEIDEQKIKELAKTWFGSDSSSATQAARQYEQALIALEDHTIDADEIKTLADAWNISEDAVAAYLLTVKVPFQITESAKVLLSASMIDAIAASWDKARLALEAYLRAAGTAQFPGVRTPSIAPGTDGNSPAAIAAAAAAAVQAAEAATDAAAVLAESEEALNESLKAAADAAAESAKFTEKLTEQFPDLMRSVAIMEASQAAKEASGRSYTTDAEMDRILSNIDSAFGRTDSAASVDYDERFRFRGFNFNTPTSTAGSDFGGGNLMAGSTVNVTVNVSGSVTAEQDLVQTIREGLLYGQGNGDSITLQAI